MTASLEHDDLANLFLSLGALQPPAELHGYAAGFVSVGGRITADGWLKHCIDLLDCETPNPEQSEALYVVYSSALESMESGEMSLDLLLPDDEFDLDQRIVSLGQWCQGYLTGFAMAGKQQNTAKQKAYSPDLTEAISDIAAIAQVSADEQTDEDGEQDFFSVCEYVRMAAMTIFLECNGAADNGEEQGNPPRLH
ncbi:Uncharacterised protein [Zhongshania aliphaticivorans]|uniref:YecA family protein n=1 Tax=Zhongshania aliphaticivorans TaxID=1470434 RepID=A0A5S9N7N9_9GAMM|nr:UPF0149 family protein [Zhongshania aliphaticivorans]CAA0079890.1 Uncharacterised protein [Zhongshania aliphaticivorans]CAA0085978.1 Uncharacterised protein [Zhongshania aliphaticivorans]